MRAAEHDAYLLIRRTSQGLHWQGTRRFFRGHRLAGRSGKHTDGIYAEWMWDGQQLVVHNDRYGVAPLFYFVRGGAIAVSPSIATLLAIGVPRELDEAALAVFLRLGFFVGDDTPFRDIRAVPPGASFSWREGVLSVSGGYAIPRPVDVSRDHALDAFVSLFHDAMARRLPADDRAVVPLSGGRDSRHILFELCALGRLPRCAVTVPRYPPRPPEDERVAPLVADAVGVPHVLLAHDGDRLRAELAKNRATHLCADEHAWFMPMIESVRSASTVYDGLGGVLSVPSRFLSREVLALFEAGRTTAIAERLLDTFSLFDEAFVTNAVASKYRRGTSRAEAVARLSTELARHAAAADPVKSFHFWSRVRRELALVPYALMRHVPAVYAPYLDRDVYDFMMALSPTVLSPTLSSADKSFHSDAIHRAFPEYVHIPFEDKRAPAADASDHRVRFARDVARHLFANARVSAGLLNRSYVLPRLLLSALRPSYGVSRPWLPSLALYLFQLDAAAAGAPEAAAPPGRDTTDVVPDVLAVAPPPRRSSEPLLLQRGRRKTTGPAAVLPFNRRYSA